MRRAKAQGKLKRRLTGTARAQTVGRAEKGARESRDVQGVGKVADRTAVSTGSQRVQVEPKQEGKGSFSRDQKPGFVLSALVRGYPGVTEPLQLVGFKQGSGKIICAFQITLASGLEDGDAGGKTVGRETVRRRPLQLSG